MIHRKTGLPNTNLDQWLPNCYLFGSSLLFVLAAEPSSEMKSHTELKYITSIRVAPLLNQGGHGCELLFNCTRSFSKRPNSITTDFWRWRRHTVKTIALVSSLNYTDEKAGAQRASSHSTLRGRSTRIQNQIPGCVYSLSPGVHPQRLRALGWAQVHGQLPHQHSTEIPSPSQGLRAVLPSRSWGWSLTSWLPFRESKGPAYIHLLKESYLRDNSRGFPWPPIAGASAKPGIKQSPYL